MDEVKKTKQDLVPDIRALIAKKYIYQKDAAEAWGFTDKHVSKIICDNNCPIPQCVLDELGYEKEITRTVIYRQKTPN